METPWAASVIAELAAGRAVEVPGVGEFSWVQGHSAQRVVQAVHFRSSPELSAQVRGDGPLEGFAAALRDDRRVVVEGLGTFEVRERRGGPQTFTRLPVLLRFLDPSIAPPPPMESVRLGGSDTGGW